MPANFHLNDIKIAIPILVCIVVCLKYMYTVCSKNESLKNNFLMNILLTCLFISTK